jgi:hypothetical protein
MSPMRPRSRSTLRAGACADESRPRSLWRSWGSGSRRDLLRCEDRRYRPVAIVRFGLLNPARRPVLKTTELWPAAGPRKIMSIVQRWIPVRTDDDPGLKVINDHRLHPRPERPIVAVAAMAPGQVRGVRRRDTGNADQKCTRKAAAHWICSRTTKWPSVYTEPARRRVQSTGNINPETGDLDFAAKCARSTVNCHAPSLHHLPRSGQVRRAANLSPALR